MSDFNVGELITENGKLKQKLQEANEKIKDYEAVLINISKIRVIKDDFTYEESPESILASKALEKHTINTLK